MQIKLGRQVTELRISQYEQVHYVGLNIQNLKIEKCYRRSCSPAPSPFRTSLRQCCGWSPFCHSTSQSALWLEASTLRHVLSGRPQRPPLLTTSIRCTPPPGRRTPFSPTPEDHGGLSPEPSAPFYPLASAQEQEAISRVF